MEGYFYCSYKGSVNGYQYAKFREGDKVIRSFSISEAKGINPRVREWFENRTGWKIILMRNFDEGIFLWKKLEEARNIEKRRELEKIEESKIAAEMDRRKEKYESVNLNTFDSDFYINLALNSSIDELCSVTAGILRELEKDGGERILNKIEKVLEKSEDRKYYKVNVEGFKAIINEVKKDNTVKKYSDCKKKGFYKIGQLDACFSGFKMGSKFHLKKGAALRKSERCEMIGKFIDALLMQKKYSKQIILFVGDNSEDREFRESVFSAEYDYFLGGIKNENLF